MLVGMGVGATLAMQDHAHGSDFKTVSNVLMSAVDEQDTTYGNAR